jgi:hypothetical protein
MIPPLTPSRVRAIERWLKDGSHAPQDPAALHQLAETLDEQMLEAFDAGTTQLQESMMRRGHWGTEDALAEYRMGELSLWSEIFETFLPSRAEPED